MKKVKGSYVAMWCGGVAGYIVLVIVAAFVVDHFVDNSMIWAIAVALGILAPIFFVPGMINNIMDKNVQRLESAFPQKGFTYQYKFTASNGVFYIDAGGRLGVVWKLNPKELSFADLTKVTDIRVNDGKQFNGGTPRVCCQFKLSGKTYRINTLLVSNGSLRMNAPEVLEAISKADKVCEMLNQAKQAALSGAAQ